MDLDKFYNYLQKKAGGQICKAIAYGTELDGEAHGFKGFLRAVGFEPRFKAHKFKEGGEVYRTDWGIGLVLDVVALVDKVDCVIICTANPEYRPLVEWVQSRGTKIVVCACGISRQLRQVIHECYEITEDMLMAGTKENSPKTKKLPIEQVRETFFQEGSGQELASTDF